jgi:hypothetical protein
MNIAPPDKIFLLCTPTSISIYCGLSPSALAAWAEGRRQKKTRQWEEAMAFSIPPEVYSMAAGALIFSSIGLILNILVVWLTWVHRERTSCTSEGPTLQSAVTTAAHLPS